MIQLDNLSFYKEISEKSAWFLVSSHPQREATYLVKVSQSCIAFLENRKYFLCFQSSTNLKENLKAALRKK